MRNSNATPASSRRISPRSNACWRTPDEGRREWSTACRKRTMSAMSGTQRNGLTIALRVGDTDEAVAFYTRVLGRGPDFVAHEDFHEWEICPGAWLQVSSGHGTNGVSSSSRLRFEVDDIAAEIDRLCALGIEVAE